MMISSMGGVPPWKSKETAALTESLWGYPPHTILVPGLGHSKPCMSALHFVEFGAIYGTPWFKS